MWEKWPLGKSGKKRTDGGELMLCPRAKKSKHLTGKNSGKDRFIIVTRQFSWLEGGPAQLGDFDWGFKLE